MNMNKKTFQKWGEYRDKPKYTDEELLEVVDVHNCMIAYFVGRKEYLIAAALRSDLHQFESYLHFRGWRLDKNEKWVKSV